MKKTLATLGVVALVVTLVSAPLLGSKTQEMASTKYENTPLIKTPINPEN